MAKSHLSLSHDPTLRNRPTGFRVPIREIRTYSGAGMLVPLCGDMLQMPGFGATPAAFQIDVDADGNVVGLF
jgi:formyltetrahydrofolate synthetase